jgi:DUF1009 family protein
MLQLTENLGIVTGFGRLFYEVLTLATELPGGYSRFRIKPWYPVIGDAYELVSDALGRSKEGLAVHPFRFADIERSLVENNIKRLFFTGDFPRTRFIQAHISTALGGALTDIADERFIGYFNATNAELSQPVRYFLALSGLLRDLEIKALLAHEAFPQLNIAPGNRSIRETPRDIIEQLPELIVRVGRHLARMHRDRSRFAQAVIVDNKVIAEVEARGTNDLIRRYAKHKVKRMPFLLKPPSVEFDPALDQPTIGPDTIEACKGAGVRGIVVCAETTTIANKAATLQRINDCDMFLYALAFSELRQTYEQHFANTWTRNSPIAAPLR